MNHTTDRAKKIAQQLDESPALAAAVGNHLGPQTKTRIVEGFEKKTKDFREKRKSESLLGDLF